MAAGERLAPEAVSLSPIIRMLRFQDSAYFRAVLLKAETEALQPIVPMLEEEAAAG